MTLATRTSLILGVVMTFSSVATRLQASLILDQPPTRGTIDNAGASNLNSLDAQQIADRFKTVNPAAVLRISWSGLYKNGSIPPSITTIDFTIRVIEGVQPESPAQYDESIQATFKASGLTTVSGDQVYRFTAALSRPIELKSDTYYWLSILDSDTRTSESFWWRYSDESHGSDWGFRISENDPWIGLFVPGAPDLAFTLYGVPEPSAAQLSIFIGLGVWICLRPRFGR